MEDAFVDAFCDIGNVFDGTNVVGRVGRNVVVDKVGDTSVDDSSSWARDGSWEDVDSDEVELGQRFKLREVDACETIEVDVLGGVNESDTVIFVRSGAIAMG
jgi:hypothetical protein